MRTFNPSFIEIEIEDCEIEILHKAEKILHKITCEMDRNSCSTLESSNCDDETYHYSIDNLRQMYNDLKEFCTYVPNKMY